VLLLAVVRSRRHQQQVARVRAELLGEIEALRALQLLAEEVRRQLVRLVEHDEIPGRSAELVVRLLSSRQLVEPHDEVIGVLEGIAAWRGELEFLREHAELETELLEELVAPLLD